jgi:ArsR family metal-binding transcriptional regulator
MTTNHRPSDDHDYDRVQPGSECPRCGEDDIDYLVWIDDDRVRCESCQRVYEPGRREGG